jgi:YVTN family beta-propeller protein/autotransporter-associated beta strand protein
MCFAFLDRVRCVRGIVRGIASSRTLSDVQTPPASGRHGAVADVAARAAPLTAYAVVPDCRGQVTAYAFVPNRGDRTVSVIDMHAERVLATVPVGAEPWGVAVTPDGRRAYVTNASSNSVSVLDVARRSVVTTIAVPHAPQGIAVAPDGRHVYVAATDADVLCVIDVETNTVVGSPIPAGISPWGLAITPDGRQALVVNTLANSVVVIDLATREIEARINTGALPFKVTIAPDGRHAYVSNGGANTITPIDVVACAAEAEIPVGVLPDDVAVTPDGRIVIVGNSGGNTVTFVDAGARRAIATAPVAGKLAGLGMPPHQRRLFVSLASTRAIVCIDLDTHGPIGPPLPVGALPSSPGFTASIIVPDAASSALVIADDEDLGLLGFGRFIAFNGGTLRLAGPWRTMRHVSLLAHGGSIDTAGFDAIVEGDLINDGAFRKAGAGTLALYGVNSHRGDTFILEGTLRIEDSHDAPIYVEGGVLGGCGAVRSVTVISGAISPGADRPGTLHATDVTMAPGSVLLIDLCGPVAGSDYDQLAVSGAATLNDATLTIRPRGQLPAGASFTILTNASGCFAGLPEGSVAVVGARRFHITYRGGGGSDVVLTVPC